MTRVPPGLPVWAAIHTPFRMDGALDEDGVRHNVRRYVELGLAGVFCNGLMGEGWALTLAERRAVLEAMVDEAAGRLGVSVVITADSVQETLELGAHARETGASSAVLMVPVAGPRSPEQQLAFFEHVCPRLEMPVVLFNARTAAGSALDPAVFARLCELPNLKWIKTTASKEDNAALRVAARNGVAVSDPLEEHFLENVVEHGQPLLYADPEPYLFQPGDARPVADYIAALAAGDLARAREGQARLAPVRAVFNRWIMDPLRRGHMPAAALKHWSEAIGMAGGGVRVPLSPLTADERKALDRDLAACGLV